MVQDVPIRWRDPHVFVMNHQSLLDIPLAMSIFDTPLHFVAKTSLFKIPLFGSYMRRVAEEIEGEVAA